MSEEQATLTNDLTVALVTLAKFAINSQPINCFNFFALSLSASAGIKFYWKETVKLYWIFSLILAAFYVPTTNHQLKVLFLTPRTVFRRQIICWEQAAEMRCEVMGLPLLTLNRVFARLSLSWSWSCEWWEDRTVHQNYPASRYKQWTNYTLWEIFITHSNLKWDSTFLIGLSFAETENPILQN